jgi:hypothetical protein
MKRSRSPRSSPSTPAPGGGGDAGARGLPQARRERADFLLLEAPVRVAGEGTADDRGVAHGVQHGAPPIGTRTADAGGLDDRSGASRGGPGLTPWLDQTRGQVKWGRTLKMRGPKFGGRLITVPHAQAADAVSRPARRRAALKTTRTSALGRGGTSDTRSGCPRDRPHPTTVPAAVVRAVPVRDHQRPEAERPDGGVAERAHLVGGRPYPRQDAHSYPEEGLLEQRSSRGRSRRAKPFPGFPRGGGSGARNLQLRNVRDDARVVVDPAAKRPTTRSGGGSVLDAFPVVARMVIPFRLPWWRRASRLFLGTPRVLDVQDDEQRGLAGARWEIQDERSRQSLRP